MKGNRNCHITEPHNLPETTTLHLMVVLEEKLPSQSLGLDWSHPSLTQCSNLKNLSFSEQLHIPRPTSQTLKKWLILVFEFYFY